MKCRYCNSPTGIIDSRKKDGYVRRRHQCSKNTRHRFSTIELYSDEFESLINYKEKYQLAVTALSDDVINIEHLNDVNFHKLRNIKSA